jgi:hypothetical protein
MLSKKTARFSPWVPLESLSQNLEVRITGPRIRISGKTIRSAGQIRVLTGIFCSISQPTQHKPTAATDAAQNIRSESFRRRGACSLRVLKTSKASVVKYLR